MKTKEQIKKWLASQPWFPEYVDRLLCARTREAAITYINGEREDLTLSGAFGWGSEWEEWNKRDNTFRLWLKSVTFATIKEGQQFYYGDGRYIKVGGVTAVEIQNITRFPETCEVIAAL